MPDFTDKLVPGLAISEQMIPGLTQGTGQADGIIFLNGKIDPHTGQTLIISKFRESLRYLKGQTPEWLMLNPGARGRCKPDVWKLRNLAHNRGVSDQIEKVAQDSGQSIEHIFLTTQRGIDAVQPEHLFHWHIVPVPGAEGIWCVFYV